MDDKTYTVMELAEAVGVARTTINDWLSKYSPYIDFRTVGRRRVYTAAAVEVLKEISELRNKGLSSGDIETELAKKHPMRAEPADLQEKTEQNAKENVPVPRSEASEGAAREDFALIAQRQSDEIGRLFAESFQNMANRIETLENKAGNAERKLYIGYGIVFVLLLLLCVLSFFLFFGIRTQTEQNLINAGKTAENGAAIRSVEDRTVRLTGSAEELKKGIAELKSGLAVQKREFDKALSAMKSSRDAEVAAMKERFAAEKKSYLEKLDKLNGENEKVVRELTEKLNHQSELIRNDEKAKMIQDLEARLKQQEKQLRDMEAKSSRSLKELEAKLKEKEKTVSTNKVKSESAARTAEEPKKGK